VKKWYQSKTVWFNILTIGGAVAGGMLGILPSFSPLLTEQTYALLLVTVSTVNVVLRAVTNGPIEWGQGSDDIGTD
jgi:hypothetical protein